MDKKLLNGILDNWKIRDESERWSLISMFLRYHGEQFTRDDFVNFLQSVYRKPIRLNYNLSQSDKLLKI